MIAEIVRQQTLELFLKTHVHNGKPINFPEGQRQIYRAVLFREYKRVQITCCTQYGKTHTVGCACLPVTCVAHKKIAILAPTTSKAKLIMRDYIDHLGDNPLYYEELEKNTKLERLRMEESKERIALKSGGCIYVISCQEGNSMKRLEAAMGEGAEIVILDEGALISDETEATIFRMGAGQGDNFCYIKIGNPFTRGHFLASYNDPNYKKINIDYKQALAEGRYTQNFINEAKKKPLFDVLFENKFPGEEVIDKKGWRKLLKEAEVNDAKAQDEDGNPTINIEEELQKYKARRAEEEALKAEGKPIDNLQTPESLLKGRVKLGGDIGRGNNKSTYVLRWDNYAIIISSNTDPDLMAQVPIILGYKKEFFIDDTEMSIDDNGIGGGVTDRLHELGCMINGVKVGESAVESDQYANLRAELYFLVREWILEGGKLVPNKAWEQLNVIRYKEASNSKLKIIPKEDLQKDYKDELKLYGIDSPDEADGLSLTFSNNPVVTSNDFAIG